MIEVIVVIAIVAILASFGLWVGLDAYRGYSYYSQRDSFISALQKARLESMVNLNEAKHGMYVETDRYTIFQGSSYGSRISAFDRVMVPGGGITISGNPAIPAEVIFEQLSGAATDQTLTFSDGIKTKTISINNGGQISW